MKRILVLFLALLIAHIAQADEGNMYDFDMKFLDNPFAGQKIITKKEFDAVTKKTEKKEPSKFSKWLWGVKGDNTPPQNQSQYNSMPSEMGNIKDDVNLKPVITLGANIMDSDNKIISAGHYQVDLKDNYIVFLQAHQTVGRFYATPCKDDYKTNQIFYSRLVEEANGIYRIIFSNLDGTHQGYARILE